MTGRQAPEAPAEGPRTPTLRHRLSPGLPYRVTHNRRTYRLACHQPHPKKRTGQTSSWLSRFRDSLPPRHGRRRDIAPRGSQHLSSLEHARTASPHHSPFDIVFQPFRAGPMGSARVSLRSQVSRVEGCNFAGSQQVNPKPSPHGLGQVCVAVSRDRCTFHDVGADSRHNYAVRRLLRRVLRRAWEP